MPRPPMGRGGAPVRSKAVMTDRELLRHIERLPGGRAGYKQLVRELGLGGGQERRLLREQLERLTDSRLLVHADRNHWSLPKAASTNHGLPGPAGAGGRHPT